MTLGPRTEAALKDGPQFVDGALVALADGRTLRSRAPESLESFTRRVALIAVEEERERLMNNTETLRDPKEATDEYSLGWDSAIRAVKEAAIREGR